MNINKSVSRLLLCAIVAVSFITGCREAAPMETVVAVDQIVVRMPSEPKSLNPILAKSSLDREIYQYLYVNLADYDHQTLELRPVLIESIPEARVVEEDVIAYDMRMKEEATWADGQPITGDDVLFTYKIASHPNVLSPGWKGLLNDITGIEVDSEDPKKFTVITAGDYFLNKETLLSTEIFPRHLLDPKGALSSISLEDIRDEKASTLLLENEAFQAVAKSFSSVENNKTKVSGAGPYSVESVETGQYIVLKKKENYWGNKYATVDQLKSYPERIVFQFIKDETTALTLLKNDEIDVIDFSKMPIAQYKALMDDAEFSKKYNFETVGIQRYLMLLLNNEDVRLADREVRIALRHLVNVDRLVEQLEGGYGTKVNSPIHFSKPEYNKNLPNQEYSIDKANAKLELAGWKDSDGDGVRDKVINGRKESLSFRFHITGSSLSTSASAIIKEACKLAGLEINIIEKPWGATRSENLNTGDYDMLISAKTVSPVKDDPFLTYHSSNIGIGKDNTVRYASNEADELMEIIRETDEEEEREQAYLDFQKVFERDVPSILLYSPQLRIIVDKQIEPVTSSARPGYFVNANASL